MHFISVFQLPVQPVISADIIRRPTSIAFTWNAPSSGGTVDSYTVQYSASVRGCNVQSQGGPISINSTQRNFTITGLEEDSDVSVIITAVNIRGSTSAPVFTTSTTIAGMLI